MSTARLLPLLACAPAWLLAGPTSDRSPPAPFIVVLDVGARQQATAVLRNQSSRNQWLLVGDLQPTIPLLRKRGGDEVAMIDGRMTSKFDNIPHRHLFVRVAPNASVSAGGGGFERLPDGAYVFHWGWFSAPRVEAGCYQLAIRWTSRIKGWNEEDGRWRPRADLWLGDVQSMPSELCLP